MRVSLLACVFSLVACGSSAASETLDSSTPMDTDSGGGRTDSGAKDAGHDAEANGQPSLAVLDTATGNSVTRVLLGDPLDVVLSGFPAEATVTVSACFAGRQSWASSAEFQASPTGGVDLASSVAKAGSYSGVDSDGLIWSMTPHAAGCASSQPVDSIAFTASVAGKALASATVTLLLMAEGVTCSMVTDDGLVGYYCAAKGAPKAGGIVAFGGSEGGLETGQALAEYYASLGYPTLGLAYFGAPGVPSSLVNIPLEYFQKAFKWLRGQSAVLPGKLLVNGASRGGELALLLGATFSEVTAVVAELPSGVRWPGLDGVSAPWTYQGSPLAFVPIGGDGAAVAVKEPNGVTAYSDLPGFLSSIAAATPAQIAAATTQVQNTKGPVLVIGGFDDQLWGACNLSQYAVSLLVSSGHSDTYADSLLCYPGAGHNVISFNLDLPTTEAMYFDESGGTFALGGTPQGIADAARDADTKKRAFFATNLR
jgi:hypothetical protein